jgi:DNA-binding NtrC family response regulator
VSTARRRSILIVEDEAVVAEDLQHRLDGLGYEIAGWATNAADALVFAEDTAPDLVLMDIRLRGEMDGVEAASAIRDRVEVPVVFVTALADADTLERAKAADPLGYVVKPFSDRDLETAIELALYKHEMDRRLRASNRELAEERGFLEAMFEAVPSSVLVVDGSYRIRMINRHTKETFRGATPEGTHSEIGEILQCPYALGRPGECGYLDECLVCHIRQPFLAALEKGEVTLRKRCDVESRVDGRPRRMTLQISAAPLEYKGEPMVIVILEDVTELSGLRELLRSEKSFAGIVGTSPRMLEIFDTIREIADVNVPVLILGESGTGKELVARAIHSEGSRSGAAFVPVNCAALPDGLLESELFGHVKGAFTGAVRDRRGRFELADGGTIFLDEIGDLSPNMQVKLLRVLQESSFERVGGEKTLSVDVRVVCATNKDLAREVEGGEFRDDLYYRLCVVPITIPPLRQRGVDIPSIAEHILAREASSAGGRVMTLSPDVVSVLTSYDWPGNVRELQNALQFAFIKCKGDVIEVDHLPPSLRKSLSAGSAQRRVSQGLTDEAIAAALRETGGNRTKAAELLGVSRATFYRYLSDSGS